MRSSRPVWALVAGLTCLALAGVVGVQASQTALLRAGDQRTLLQSTARTTALQLSQQSERTRTIALMLAQNPAFLDFYTEPGTRAAKVKAHGKNLQNIELALEQLRGLLGGKIGESDFIDASGTENSRMVDLVSAAPGQLTPDETRTPFFLGAIAQAHGEVYQSAPYVSPETQQWVVAEATPVEVGGRNVAIVHFEVPVETLRASAATSASTFDIRVVEASTGAVVMDTLRPQALNEPLGNPADRSFTTLARQNKLHGETAVGTQQAVFAAVPAGTTPGKDANDWIVVVSGPKVAGGWLAAASPLAAGLAALGLILLGLAAPMFARVRRQRRAERLNGEAERAELTGRFDDLTHALTLVAEGDLGVRLPAPGLGDDSLNRLVTSFDDTVGRLRVLVGDAQSNSDQLSSSASDLRSMASEQADAATEQASVVARTTATIEELAATASQIAETTLGVSAVAEQTQLLAEEGRSAVDASAAAMDRIASRVGAMSESSAELQNHIGEVGRILDLIDALSDQTNLLALNAAIEAARAGDHGRGFAVVAVEVRKLAERAHDATAHIQSIVTQIQARAAASVLACEHGTREVSEGAALAQEVAQSLARIADMTHTTTASAQEISAATAQQRAASHEVVVEMARVAEGSRRYAAGSHQTASAAEEISALSGRVRTSIETFSVDRQDS